MMGALAASSPRFTAHLPLYTPVYYLSTRSVQGSKLLAEGPLETSYAAESWDFWLRT